MNTNKELKPLCIWEVPGSTLAAVLGVQSFQNRQRDFTRGKATHFIFAVITFTGLFVVDMSFVVKIVLSSAI